MNSLTRFLLVGLGIGALTLIPISNAHAFGVAISVAPPALLVDDQPPLPGPGYIWTPGYWAWDAADQDYYWVSGEWVLAPEVGLLWTPGWWSCDDGFYSFHDGCWGRDVGFYGGIDYGHGYWGHGYDGGRWNHGHFAYNRDDNNLGRSNVATFSHSRGFSQRDSRVSFNGGRGGTTDRPTALEQRASHESHLAATSTQTRHFRAATALSGHNSTAANGERTFTGANRNAVTRDSAFTGAPATTHHAGFASHDAAFTGEASHRTASTHLAATHHSAFTGATEHHASTPHFAESHAAYHASAFHASSTPHFNHAAMSHSAPHFSAQHFSAPHFSSAHASAPHFGGGGGGGHPGGGGGHPGGGGGGGGHHR